MEESAAMRMCPMAKTCKGMMEKPRSGFLLMLPGVVLIILGLAHHAASNFRLADCRRPHSDRDLYVDDGQLYAKDWQSGVKCPRNHS